MKSLRWLSSCALALLLAPTFAKADKPVEAPPAAPVERLVQDRLVKPLAELEANTSPFSRARLPPHERRVRVTQATPALDTAGRAFVGFAVDVRFGGGDWQENDIVGCAYTKTGELFVKRGDAYRPASFLLGKSAEPVAGVCQSSA